MDSLLDLGSHFIPSQDLVFLGARLQPHLFLVSLPSEKEDNLVRLVQYFRVGFYFSAHRWLQLLGHLASTIHVVHMARLFLRPVQFFVFRQWNHKTLPLSFKMLVKNKVYKDLGWWRNKNQ